MNFLEAIQYRRFKRSSMAYWLSFRKDKYSKGKCYLSIDIDGYISGIQLTFEDINANDWEGEN